MSTQKGIAPLTIVLVVAAVILLGGGAWYMTSRGRSETGEMASDSTVPADDVESGAGLSFSGTYFDTIMRDQPLECEWQAPSGGPDQAGQGKLYTDGVGRGRSEATFTVAGAESKSNAIFMDNAVFQWTELPTGQKIGIRITQEEAQTNDEALTDKEKEQGAQYASEYSFSCRPWDIDEEMFVLPDDVEFTDASSLMP